MKVGHAIGELFRRREPEDVVQEFGPQVFRHLRRIFGPQADIDDVYQAVFVEILRSLPSFRGLSKMSTWIRRITWNVAYQEMRLQYRHQHTTPLNEARTASSERNPEQAAEERLAMRRLYASLAQLDPRQRCAVIMHDIEGKTLRQISSELGRPLPTVASQLYAGRTRLAEMMSRRSGAAHHGNGVTGRQRSIP